MEHGPKKASFANWKNGRSQEKSVLSDQWGTGGLGEQQGPISNLVPTGYLWAPTQAYA